MNSNKTSYVCNGLAAILTAIQENQVLQLISFICTLLSVVVSLCFSVWKWYKAAKEDDDIDTDEITKGFDIINDHINKIEESINEHNHKDSSKENNENTKDERNEE